MKTESDYLLPLNMKPVDFSMPEALATNEEFSSATAQIIEDVKIILPENIRCRVFGGGETFNEASGSAKIVDENVTRFLFERGRGADPRIIAAQFGKTAIIAADAKTIDATIRKAS